MNSVIVIIHFVTKAKVYKCITIKLLPGRLFKHVTWSLIEIVTASTNAIEESMPRKRRNKKKKAEKKCDAPCGSNARAVGKETKESWKPPTFPSSPSTVVPISLARYPITPNMANPPIEMEGKEG